MHLGFQTMKLFQPPPMCKRCNKLVKGQEPDNWHLTWVSYCAGCEIWNEHTSSEKENRAS